MSPNNNIHTNHLVRKDCKVYRIEYKKIEIFIFLCILIIIKAMNAIAAIHTKVIVKQKILAWHVIWHAFKIEHKCVAALMLIQFTKLIIVWEFCFVFVWLQKSY